MRLWTQRYQGHLERACYRLGLSIGTHPWKYIGALCLLTFISTAGFVRFHQINNARVTFTDSESMSHVEGRVMELFLKQNGSLHMVEVMIKASDNGSILRKPHREQIKELTTDISSHIKVEHEGHKLSYNDMCAPYCEKNDAFYALLTLYGDNVTDMEVEYPTVDVFGKGIFIANNVYDVHHIDNSTTYIDSAKTILLRYYLVYKDVNTMLKWEDKLVHLLYDSHKYPLLRCQAGSDNLVAKEVKAMGTRTAPLLAISLLLLMFFLFVCSFRYKRRESKGWEALLGGVIPLLAGITTVGLVSATGLAFQSIVVSSLFLLLAIGIDDVFIMLSAWHRTDRNLEIRERVAEMVKESGCSMTVTSITNIISFGNGVLSTTPVLQTFAIYSTAASVVCFAYQLILFPAIITLTAPNEYKKSDKKTCLPEEIKVIKPLGRFHDVFWRRLAKIVTHPATAVTTIVILLGYWALAVYGISIVQTDLSVQKLAPADARIVKYKNDYDKSATSMQTTATVVTNPGNLKNHTQMDRVKNLVKEHEHATFSFGHESTYWFLDQYMEFLAFYGDDDQEQANFTYTSIPEFVDSDPHIKPTIHINETACGLDQPNCIEAFLFTTGFTTVTRYHEIYPLVEEWRAINRKYSDLHAYSYSERSNFADQTAALSEIVWQTLLSEVICMGLSFLVLVPDTDSILAAMFALLSVNLGVFGFLSLWGVGIDPVSMAALLMSIGFSVDISAHISYHYYTVHGTARERLEDAFLNIGWPTVQGGMSTLLAMLPILISPSYLGMVFLKAVALVIIFGLIHGLIVLPVFLSLIDKSMRLFKRDKLVPLDGSPNGSMTAIEPHRISIKSFTHYKIDR